MAFSLFFLLNKSERENALFNFYKIYFIIFSGESKKLRFIFIYSPTLTPQCTPSSPIPPAFSPRYASSESPNYSPTSQNKARHLQCSKEVQHHRNIHPHRPNTLPRVQHTVQLLQNIHLVHPTIPQVHQPTVKNNSTRTMIIIR